MINLLELDKTVDRGLRDKSAAKYLNTFYKDFEFEALTAKSLFRGDYKMNLCVLKT